MDLLGGVMKAILKFNLPEEREDHLNALYGYVNKMKIDTLYDEVFRPIFKYDQPIKGKVLSDSERELLEQVWELLYEHFNRN
jgi:hypothetical protein